MVEDRQIIRDPRAIKLRINMLCLAGVGIGIFSFFLPWAQGEGLGPITHFVGDYPHYYDTGDYVFAFTWFFIGTFLAIFSPYAVVLQFIGSFFEALLVYAPQGEYPPIGVICAMLSTVVVAVSIFNPLWFGYKTFQTQSIPKWASLTFEFYRKSFRGEPSKGLKVLHDQISASDPRFFGRVEEKNQRKIDRTDTQIELPNISCPYCGRENPAAQKYCETCGFNVADFYICIACNKKIPTEVNICPNCGFDIKSNSRINDIKWKGKKCPACGKFLKLSAKTCYFCGYDFR